MKKHVKKSFGSIKNSQYLVNAPTGNMRTAGSNTQSTGFYQLLAYKDSKCSTASDSLAQAIGVCATGDSIAGLLYDGSYYSYQSSVTQSGQSVTLSTVFYSAAGCTGVSTTADNVGPFTIGNCTFIETGRYYKASYSTSTKTPTPPFSGRQSM